MAIGMGRGRIAGSRNKPKEFPFVKEDATGVSARRFRIVGARIATDLGGEDCLTEAQQQLVRRAAMLSVQCEFMEAQALGGLDFNAVAYGQLTGHLTRTLNALGLKREPIDVTPVLHQYLDEPEPAETLEIPEPAAAGDENEG